jgi:two-component system NarL family sensor kinase
MPEDFRDIQEGFSSYVKIGTVIFLVLAALFVFFIVSTIQRKRKLLTAQKEMHSRHTEALLLTEIEIKEQTLKTISQEIHDNVGQVLSLAKLNLNTLDFDTGVSKEEKIEKSIQLVSKAINDLRELSKSLNGDKVADLGLPEAIANELQIIKNTGQFDTRLILQGSPCPLPPNVEMVMFRIVQESLNNAVKHSKAQHITVTIGYDGSQCSVEIVDDGVGFDADQMEATQTGIGLKNMQSRAQLVNAYFNLESTPGKGTRVILKTQP